MGPAEDPTERLAQRFWLLSWESGKKREEGKGVCGGGVQIPENGVKDFGGIINLSRTQVSTTSLLFIS